MRRFHGLYYGFQFFFNLLLWLPIFYDFQKRIGLSETQIFDIQTLYYLAFCLVDIPTGVLADRWGYRTCMRLGAVVLTASNLLPVFAQSYWGMLVHFLLIALARSLVSGAASAYLYDYLRARGEGDAYKRVEGLARTYGLAGKVVFWAGIGALMAWQLSLPYALTALCSAISVAFAWLLPPLDPAPGPAKEREGFLAGLKPLVPLIAGSPRLLLLMLQGVGIFVLTRICQVNLFQPILADKAFAVQTFGLILAVNTVFEALGSAYAHKLRRWCSDLTAVSVLTIALGLSLSLIAWSGPAWSVFWLTFFALVAGLAYPIQRQLLNDAIPATGHRSTLLSLESLIDRAACAGVAALLGGFMAAGKLDAFLHLSDGVSLVGTLAITGLLVLAAGRATRARGGAAEPALPGGEPQAS